jgi:predicted aspartyl protease
MTGEIDETGTPIIRLSIADQEWIATIDTGFNGDLELPEQLADVFTPSTPASPRPHSAAVS